VIVAPEATVTLPALLTNPCTLACLASATVPTLSTSPVDAPTPKAVCPLPELVTAPALVPEVTEAPSPTCTVPLAPTTTCAGRAPCGSETPTAHVSPGAHAVQAEAGAHSDEQGIGSTTIFSKPVTRTPIDWSLDTGTGVISVSAPPPPSIDSPEATSQ